MKVIAMMNACAGGIGGGDIRFTEIAKRLISENFDLWVVTSRAGRYICEKYGLAAKFVPTTDEVEVGNVVYTYLKRIMKALLLKIDLRDGDILFSSSDFLPDVLPAYVSKIRNKNLMWVATVYHLIPSPLHRTGGLKLRNLLSFIGQRLSLYLIKRSADLIQTETLFVKRKLTEEYEIPLSKIIAVQSGVKTTNENLVSPNMKKIYDACFLARIHPSKGVFDLIEAWKLVCKRKKDATLVIAGGGSDKVLSELRRRIRDSGLEENVFVLGFLSEEEKYRLFMSSKLYVLPSYEEGIPITFYEAMYFGLPVITYYLPTYEEIKDYIVSVPTGDVKKLSEEIVRLLENKDSAQKLGDKGREFAEEHTWDKVADYIISRIEELVYGKG